MSDSTKDRRHPARRGSLLDHAGEVPSAPVGEPGLAAGRRGDREAVADSARAQPVSRRPAPSLLSAPPARSPRLSTADYVPAREAAPAPTSAPAAPAAARPEPAAEVRDAPKRAQAGDTARFGDRIARLIGAVPQREARPAPAPEQPPLEPQATATGHREASAGEAAPRARAMPEDEPAPERAPLAERSEPRQDDHYHWHAAGGDNERPLLDASILLQAVFRYRRYIAGAAVAGAVLGALFALSTPHRYYAESRLFIDPREVRVTEDDIRNQQLSTEAMLAITDSQLQILSSTSVLEKVINDLGLERDPEFNGSLSSGGISGGLALIKELISGDSGPSAAEQKALEKLRDSLTVSRDAKTFVIIVGVTTREADKSALIANQVVETYLDSEGRAQSSLLERTSESIDTRLNALRSDLDAAEREVEKFKADNGLVGVGGQYIDDKVILALSDQLANARAMKVGIRVKANNLAKVNIDDVLSGAFPEELLSTNLTELRKQYTETKSNAESLATGLGPRHPRYIAARSALDTIREEISAELRRIVASSQTELQRAVETEQELASQMAVAKSRAMDQSVEFVTLRELERKAAATRGIYEAFLSRSRETSERSNLSTRNVRVISPAEAPLQPMGPSRKLIAIAGLFAGLFAGIGVALLVGVYDSIRAYNAGSGRARFQAPPYGFHPSEPDPAPRTPGGPGRRAWRRGDEDGGMDFDRAADQATASAFSAPVARAEARPVRPNPIRQESAASDFAPVPAAATQVAPPPGRPHVAAAGLDPAARRPAAPDPVPVPHTSPESSLPASAYVGQAENPAARTFAAVPQANEFGPGAFGSHAGSPGVFGNEAHWPQAAPYPHAATQGTVPAWSQPRDWPAAAPARSSQAPAHEAPRPAPSAGWPAAPQEAYPYPAASSAQAAYPGFAPGQEPARHPSPMPYPVPDWREPAAEYPVSGWHQPAAAHAPQGWPQAAAAPAFAPQAAPAAHLHPADPRYAAAYPSVAPYGFDDRTAAASGYRPSAPHAATPYAAPHAFDPAWHAQAPRGHDDDPRRSHAHPGAHPAAHPTGQPLWSAEPRQGTQPTGAWPSAPQPASAYARPHPARTDAVDRIRRDMDALRSRIDGYGATRRSG